MQSAADVTQTMGQMKGVMMKVGQVLSFTSSALPDNAQRMLKSLQRDAPPMSRELARHVLEEELGHKQREVAQFDDDPIAAASIGQVHRATLVSGRKVVFKLQYPGVDKAIEHDLRFAGGMMKRANAFFPNAQAEPVLEELVARIGEELDYQREAENQAAFAKAWDGHPFITVPAVVPHLSTKRVLCQEFCRGLTFDEFVERASSEEKSLAALVLSDFVFDSLYRFRMFNGDPHPGNYLFRADGGITFLDFGCTKYFSADTIGRVGAINRAILLGDRDSFDRLVHEIGIILPGRPYDREATWEFFRYHAAPFLKDEVFTFNDDYVDRAAEVMAPEKLRKFNLPPDIVLFNRITFGLNALFARLGASANFHRIYRRYFCYPDERHPPALAHIGVTLPERFLAPDPAPCPS